MKLRLLATLVALTAFFMVVLPGNAEARRGGIAVINTGDDVFQVGPLPEPYAANPELAGYQAGYKCEVFGIMWAYLHMWDCTPVAYSEAEETFLEDPELGAAISAMYTESDMQFGLWEGYGRWAFLLLALGAGGYYLYSARKGGDDEEEPSERASATE